MVGQTQADNIISNALYVISTGTNDYVLSYYVNPLVQKKYSIPAYQQLIRDTATVYLQVNMASFNPCFCRFFNQLLHILSAKVAFHLQRKFSRTERRGQSF